MISIKSVVEKTLTRNLVYDVKPEEVLIWAFGIFSGSMKISEIPKVWNEKHGDKFLLFGWDDLEKSMERITDVYLSREGE